jgi:hypothetical protein
MYSSRNFLFLQYANRCDTQSHLHAYQAAKARQKAAKARVIGVGAVNGSLSSEPGGIKYDKKLSGT